MSVEQFLADRKVIEPTSQGFREYLGKISMSMQEHAAEFIKQMQNDACLLGDHDYQRSLGGFVACLMDELLTEIALSLENAIAEDSDPHDSERIAKSIFGGMMNAVEKTCGCHSPQQNAIGS